MGKSPKWIYKKIEEIYEVLGGGTPSTKKSDYWNGSIPWVTSADITPSNGLYPRKTVTKTGIANSAANMVPADSIIVATRVGLGKVGLTIKETSFSQDCQGLVPKYGSFPASKYALLALNVLTQTFRHNSRGTTISGVTKKQLKELEIPLPPLPEQHRIVAKIEELFSDLDAGIASLKKAKEQLKTYRQSVLKWAFEGKLTQQWRKKNNPESASELLKRIQEEREKKYKEECEKAKKEGKRAPKKMKELPPITKEELAELAELPKGWEWVRFNDVLNRIEAGKSFKCAERKPEKDEIGVAKVSAISWGEYNELESKTCRESNRFNQSYLISQGDFLFSRANTIELVGACVIVKKKTKLKIMLSDKTLRFKFLNINPYFFLFYLRCHYGRREIERHATGNQNSMRNIGQDRIHRILIGLPSKSEQDVIVAEIESRLSEADNLEKTIDEALAKSDALRQSILKRAFEGKLVPQDPNDEPAEKLLERIRQEQSTILPKKQPRKRKRNG